MSTRQILANNIKALMQLHPELNSIRKLSARCLTPTDRKVGHNTIARVIDPRSSVQPQLDTIVAIAQVFHVQPWMLLSPDFDAKRKTVADLPSPEVIAMARRIMENRTALMDVLGTDAVSDEEMESNGWKAPAGKAPCSADKKSEAPKVHEPGAHYKIPPRQTKIKFKP